MTKTANIGFRETSHLGKQRDILAPDLTARDLPARKLDIGRGALLLCSPRCLAVFSASICVSNIGDFSEFGLTV